MATHELDSFKTTEHLCDYSEIGRLPVSSLGFNMLVGFSQALERNDFSLVEQASEQLLTLNTTESL